MKAVLISIRPKWCQKIINGWKTIEVRKTRPKMNPPFKCYIYCTKGQERLVAILKDGDENYGGIYHGKPVFIKTSVSSVCDMYGKRKTVIGEFTCNRVTNLFSNSRFWLNEDDVLHTCLSAAEIRKYANGANGLYGWHISNLRIYDTPRELREFYAVPNEAEVALKAKPKPVTRPPQSWRYVEELP